MNTLNPNNVSGTTAAKTSSGSTAGSATTDKDKDKEMVRKSKTLTGFVGLPNLPNQVHRYAVKNGFEFNMMVVGESGLGKSTFINSLFLAGLYDRNKVFPKVEDRSNFFEDENCKEIKKTIQIESSCFLLEEKGVKLRLTLVDTPGFGDRVDNRQCIAPVLAYVKNCYFKYLKARSKIQSSDFLSNENVKQKDQRIHACLYFIPPTVHGLRPIDVLFMKQLGEWVNVIPIIAKSDCLNMIELEAFKLKIAQDVKKNNIVTFNFSKILSGSGNSSGGIDVDKVAGQGSTDIFAVMGSNSPTRERGYPWGTVNIEDERICDFKKLRQLLIRTHMHALLSHTHEVLYEKFKADDCAHANLNISDDHLNDNILDDESFLNLGYVKLQLSEYETSLQSLKNQLEGLFNQKVASKEKSLKAQQEKNMQEIIEFNERIAQEKEKLAVIQNKAKTTCLI